MKTYYLASCSYMREEIETGILKMVTDQMIINAVSFTDAEIIINKFAEENINGDFSIKSLRKSNVSEIIRKDEESFWTVKVRMKVEDDLSGKEKSIDTILLIGTDSVEGALVLASAVFESTIAPFRIVEVKETKIVCVLDEVDS